MNEEARGAPAFACCSVGIGLWFWVAWESEAEGRSLAPALASGYEATADRAEEKAADRLGPGMRRLPAKWASAYKRRGGAGAGDGTPVRGRVGGGRGEARPGGRFGRPGGAPKRQGAAARLAFLYCVTRREPPDPHDPVAISRHRIVKQTARKIHVECDPFDEEAWARRGGGDGEGAEGAAKVRTLAVDRVILRTEGRFGGGRTHPGLMFYAGEAEGAREVEAALTAEHPWCARLGVRFPCSVGSIKAAYRRLALTSHPDVGGDPTEFRAVEQAYRAALAYFAGGGGADA